MLPKLLPILEAAFLSRHTAVRSMKPTGTRQVLPSRMKAGVGPSGFASHGFLGAAAGACSALLAAGTGAVAGAGAGGINGVVLAISPSALLRGKAKSRFSGAGVLLFTRSIIFICSWSANFN